ncbi:hypothetical protein LTS18_003224, partial [Coniosporium uncinatum]
MANPQEELPLTFGVELEGIFAFTENLRAHLDRQYPAAQIVKEPLPEEIRGFSSRDYPKLCYNSWVIANDGSHPLTIEPLSHSGCRAYRDEPLQLAHDLLANVPGRENCFVQHEDDHAKPTSYHDWSISSDHSLVALTKDELRAVLDKRSELSTTISTEDEGKKEEGKKKKKKKKKKKTELPLAPTNPSSWDSFGIELVSPPYSSPTAFLNDLTPLLHTLTTTPGYALTSTPPCCGMHVHVGLPSSTRLPLRTLQHLA